jgi:tetratricopeptide (TPR) repeat protein
MVFLSQDLGDQRLLIIDNVDDTTLELAPFLPRWRNGVVVVTSRNHSRGQLSPAGHLQLDVMTPEESAELLLRGSGKPWPPAEPDRKLAILVAEDLGCHPIALVQAVSYMYNTGCSPESYITLLRSNRDCLLRDHPAMSQVDMRYKTAFAAFDASYNILPPKAQKLWHLLSFFRWQKFPVELVTLVASEGFSQDEYGYLARGDEFDLGRECLKEIFFTENRWDLLELHSTLATLRSHSLITTTSVDKAILLQMHPLVYEWGRLRISEGDLPRFEAAAVRLLCCGAREDNYTMMQYLSSHVESLSFLWEGLHANDAASLAFILAESGIYEKSATLKGIAHGMVERELGPEHLTTTRASANLAVAYGQLGRYAEAVELQAQVLQQRKQLVGVDHPETIKATENLLAIYYHLGRYAEAVELTAQVLRQRKQTLGVDHPDTIRASAELAVTYRALGRYAEAEELDTKVLKQRKQALGADHPNTVRASAHLAATYYGLGRYAKAEELETKVLRQRKQLFGADHPETIKTSAQLATVYCALRSYTKAEEMFTEVLKKRTALLGERHPDTILSMLYLAQTYNVPQRKSEASSLAQKALQLALETLGDGHPLYQDISKFLASLPDEKPLRTSRDRFAPYKKRMPRK